MRILANGVHHRAPLWGYVDLLGENADTAFAVLVEETFEQVAADNAAAKAKKGPGR